MKKNTKIALASLATIAVAGVGYMFVKKKNETIDEELGPTQDPTVTSSNPKTNVVSTAPASLDYNSPFSKQDKAHVQIMQKMLGTTPDGAWGSKTDALIPKGLVRPFSLNQLKTALSNISMLSTKATNVKKSGLKVGDPVYAAYTTDLDVTKGAKFKDLKWTTSGPKRVQEVSKGQYLGKVVVLNPSSVLILNSYNELVLAPYSKLSKIQLNGLRGVELL